MVSALIWQNIYVNSEQLILDQHFHHEMNLLCKINQAVTRWH